MLRCRKPGANESGQHATAETMAMDEQLSIDAIAAAGERLRRAAAGLSPASLNLSLANAPLILP